MEVRWREMERAGAPLWAADYGGDGVPVVLLHGLAGYAREWDSTAAWLASSHRVVAVEARAHGRSERTPADVSPEAFVADAERWIDQLALAPAILVGQSLGGLTALLLAARRPDLVRALVIAEATPARDPDSVAAVRNWLATWPLPFPSAEHALGFFGGDTLRARTWTAGLEQRGSDLWPAFEAELLLDALAQASVREHWDDWARVRCPALLVRAAEGISAAEAARMIEQLPGTQLAEIADACHDVHLDQPQRWRQALETFLAGIER